MQPLYNLVNRDIEVELLPLCQAHGLGVVSYSPLARGILTAKYKPGEAFPEGSRAARNDKRMREAELREESLAISQQLADHCRSKGCRAVAICPGLVPGQSDNHVDHSWPADDGAVRRQPRRTERATSPPKMKSSSIGLCPRASTAAKGFKIRTIP